MERISPGAYGNRVKKRADKPQQHRSRVPRTAHHWHPNRRIIMVVRQCSPNKGEGAVRTIVECVPAEDVGAVNQLADRYFGDGVTVMTDEHPAYGSLAAHFDHHTVNHSVEFSTDDGVSNNQAESFFTRARRLDLDAVKRHQLVDGGELYSTLSDLNWRARKQLLKLLDARGDVLPISNESCQRLGRPFEASEVTEGLTHCEPAPAATRWRPCTASFRTANA